MGGVNPLGAFSLPVGVNSYPVSKNLNPEKVAKEENGELSAKGGDQPPSKFTTDTDRFNAALQIRGMEMRYVVDEGTGRAQMVISESGTGREVLKIPSDSVLLDSLLQAVTSLR